MPDTFAAASAAALGDLTTDTTPASPATPDPTPAADATPSAPSAEPTPAAPATPTTPASAAPPEDPEEEIVHEGQTVRVPKSKLKELAQKGFDYTKKTMTLAEERRQAQALQQQATQMQADLREVLSDPVKLKQLVLWAAQEQGVDPAVAAADPSTVVPTIQQVEQQIAAARQQLDRDINTKIAKAQFDIESTRLTTEYSTAIGSHIQKLLETHPLLADVEGIDRLLKDEAGAQVKARLATDPTEEIPIEDTLGFLSAAAKRRADKLEARFVERQKAEAAKLAANLNKGSEPAGGAPPAPTPTKMPKLGSSELRDLVMADLQKSLRD